MYWVKLNCVPRVSLRGRSARQSLSLGWCALCLAPRRLPLGFATEIATPEKMLPFKLTRVTTRQTPRIRSRNLSRRKEIRLARLFLGVAKKNRSNICQGWNRLESEGKGGKSCRKSTKWCQTIRDCGRAARRHATPPNTMSNLISSRSGQTGPGRARPQTAARDFLRRTTAKSVTKRATNEYSVNFHWISKTLTD